MDLVRSYWSSHSSRRSDPSGVGGVSLASRLLRFGERARQAARTLGERAEPLVRVGAAQWRRTVDEKLAPAALAVGMGAVGAASAGVDAIAGAVLGQRRKQETFRSIEETIGALGTLAKAAVTSEEAEDGETTALVDEEDYYFYTDDLQPSSSNDYFQYQQLNPTAYGPNHLSYPPPLNHPNYHSSDFSPRHHAAVAYPSSSSYYPNRLPIPNTLNYPTQTVEEALYVLGKNLLGQNVTDRLLPLAKQVAVGLGQVGQGLGTITNAIPLPAVEFGTEGVRVKTVPSRETHSNGNSNNDDSSDRARGERNADDGKKGVAVRHRIIEIKTGNHIIRKYIHTYVRLNSNKFSSSSPTVQTEV